MEAHQLLIVKVLIVYMYFISIDTMVCCYRHVIRLRRHLFRGDIDAQLLRAHLSASVLLRRVVTSWLAAVAGCWSDSPQNSALVCFYALQVCNYLRLS